MNSRTAERFSEILGELIADIVNDTKVDADDVQGLESTINDAVEEALGEFEPEANNIRGLSSEIEDVINNMTLEVDAKNVNDLEDAIDDRVNTYLNQDYDWEPVMTHILNSPSMQAALEQAVKKALLGLVQQFLSVPTAQPVTVQPVAPPVTPPAPPTVRFNGEGVITDEFRRELERGA